MKKKNITILRLFGACLIPTAVGILFFNYYVEKSEVIAPIRDIRQILLISISVSYALYIGFKKGWIK